MSLAGVAKQTLEIVERGSYIAPSGHTVELADSVAAAVNGTVLYRPDALDILVSTPVVSSESPSVSSTGGSVSDPGRETTIEVTSETTAEASRRLVSVEGERHVVALNFASAKNPGGGFLGGAKAQEEDLARCSALYTCQLTQREYYDANRATSSMLYTDHMIYSPDVPFFRDDQHALLDVPFVVSILTVPAPNAGQASKNGRHEGGKVSAVRDARAEKLLSIAAARGHRTLVLGAWGCGVFQNDPIEVAAMFDRWIHHERFRGAFDRVVFAIYDRGKGQPTLRTFQKQFMR